MYPHPSVVYGDIIPRSEFIRSLARQGTISKEAAKRLLWFDYYRRCQNARKTCRYFGISAQTFYRWKNRFDPIKLQSDDIRWQFSARDLICRWDCARAHRHCSSITATCFLEYMERKFPFRTRAIQIDGGSEFKKHFEEACQKRKIRLFVIPPRSPKLQAYVKRSNRTHREEFYEVQDVDLNLEGHNRQLERWGYTYNHIRPHRALDLLTPHEYCQRWKKSHTPHVSPMS